MIHLYLSKIIGKYSQAVIMREEESATHGMHVNNNPPEGTFTTFTGILCNAQHIDFSSATGLGQLCCNIKIFIADMSNLQWARKATMA